MLTKMPLFSQKYPMSNKYAPLTDHLAALPMEAWRPSFADIERILGFALPDSARKYPAWWANQESGTQVHSWRDAGWFTQDLDLGAERITFSRDRDRSTANPRPRSSRPTEDHPTCDWDVSGDFRAELQLVWTHAGAIILDSAKRLLFPTPPECPGLYRMRIRRKDGTEARYIGETFDLRRRFANYRNPGDTQQTNLRINQILIDALEDGAQVAVSILTDQAWIIQDGNKDVADFTRKPVRRLFENFAQIVEGDVAVEDLNR
ncbi:MAG: hypothetical protein P4L33_18130 [Capsulimonadaceae bacterium]|nr:hypothetical protein [Capsulimonadaceae bacterium]